MTFYFFAIILDNKQLQEHEEILVINFWRSITFFQVSKLSEKYNTEIGGFTTE